MSKAYGFIEISGVVAAIDALDIMCKAAEVSLATWERKLGGRLVTLVVEGEVSAVKAAVEAAKNDTTIKKPVASGVLAAPHEEIQNIVAISASRFKGKGEETSDSKMLGQDPPDFNIKEQMNSK
ncbi:MAG: BMC domain-containing protein [Lachnospiraceae bacterium]|nr:BMC domain-containing protein [Lachnospiraceae bacterium]